MEWHGTCGAFIQGKAKQSRSGEINGVLPDRQRSNREWSVGQSAIQKRPPEDSREAASHDEEHACRHVLC